VSGGWENTLTRRKAIFRERSRPAYEAIANLYHDLGCEYHLVSLDSRSRPNTPGLTAEGFTKWFVINIRAYPDEEANRLAKIASALPINADSLLDGKSERLPKQISRHLLPAKSDWKARQLLDEAVEDLRQAMGTSAPVKSLSTSQLSSLSSKPALTLDKRQSVSEYPQASRSRYAPSLRLEQERKEERSSLKTEDVISIEENRRESERKRSSYGGGGEGPYSPRDRVNRRGSRDQDMFPPPPLPQLAGPGSSRVSRASWDEVFSDQKPSGSMPPPPPSATGSSKSTPGARRTSPSPAMNNRHSFPAKLTHDVSSYDRDRDRERPRDRDRDRDREKDRQRDRERDRDRERERERDRERDRDRDRERGRDKVRDRDRDRERDKREGRGSLDYGRRASVSTANLVDMSKGAGSAVDRSAARRSLVIPPAVDERNPGPTWDAILAGRNSANASANAGGGGSKSASTFAYGSGSGY
jgi:hypothetical protein